MDDTIPVITPDAPPSVTVCGLCTATYTFTSDFSPTRRSSDLTINVRVLATDHPGVTSAVLTVDSLTGPVNDRTVHGHVDVSGVDCPASVKITYDAKDCCGKPAAQKKTTTNVLDDTIPEITPDAPPSVTVGGLCTATYNFTAEITDNCCIDDSTINVRVLATDHPGATRRSSDLDSLTGPVNDRTVHGHVDVSGVHCPASVKITYDA